ncbi:MAG: helix-turn-helix domain containing protein [Patulibacter minatonensis]
MSTPEATPPLRADARRNRDAILTAARQVFADEGLGAPLDRIAKLAEVGRATLYRRFPTREDLVRAIFQDNLDELEAVAKQAGDAPGAFLTIFDAAVAQQRDNLGIIELFTRPQPATDEHPDGLEIAAQVRVPWSEIIREPLARAQAAGLVRDDLEPEDTGALLVMTGALAAGSRGRPEAELRYTRILQLLRDAVAPAGGTHPLDPAAG